MGFFFHKKYIQMCMNSKLTPEFLNYIVKLYDVKNYEYKA